MKKITQAGDALERLALQYAEIAAAAAEIKELGGLKSLRDGLTAEIEQLKAESATERAAAERASNERIEIERTCGEMRQRARDEIQAETAKSAAEVDEIRTAAKAQAEAIVATARAEADSKIGAIGGQLAAMQAKLDDLNKEVGKAEEVRDAAKAELELINKRIADAKETIQKMMGA